MRVNGFLRTFFNFLRVHPNRAAAFPTNSFRHGCEPPEKRTLLVRATPCDAA
jgi:hypothetical protein